MKRLVIRKADFEEIKKAIRDRSHLTKKQITDKNGHIKNVWVNNEVDQKQIRTKKVEEPTEKRIAKPEENTSNSIEQQIHDLQVKILNAKAERSMNGDIKAAELTKQLKQLQNQSQNKNETKTQKKEKDPESLFNQNDNNRDKIFGSSALWEQKINNAIKTGDENKINETLNQIKKEYSIMSKKATLEDDKGFIDAELKKVERIAGQFKDNTGKRIAKPEENKQSVKKPDLQEYFKAKKIVQQHEQQYKKEMDDYEYKQRVNSNGYDTNIFNPMYGNKPKPLSENSSYMEALEKVKAFEGTGTTEENKTPVVSIADKYNTNQEISFEYGGNTLKGTITAKGKDGVTVRADGDKVYKVNYNAINSITKNSDGTIPAASFNAQDYKKSQTDPKVTNDEAGANHIYDLLKADPEYSPELIDRIIEGTQKRLSTQDKRIKSRGDTEKVYSDGEGNYTESRKELHKKIIETFLSKEKVEKAKPKPGEQPKFIMLGGRGGSGKSWFTDKKRAEKEGREVMFDEENYIILDADAIKDFLKPPYEGWNAGEVHEESSYLNKLIKQMAMEKGCNIIIDGTMNYNAKKPDKIRNEMLDAKNSGYRIEAHYMFLPIQESCKRAVMRFANKKKGYDLSGRLVPMNILTGMQDNEKSFDSVKDIVDDWSFRDNNVKFGEQPKLISKK